jgi:sulfate/thiosulfate transport system permease protein
MESLKLSNKFFGKSKSRRKKILPGFGLTFGFMMIYLSLLLLIPLSTIFIKTAGLSWNEFWNIVTDPRVIESYKISFGASLIAALIDCVFGFLAAWVLVRYDFPGKRILDSIVDLPFALPTAIAGISLTAVFATNSWLGRLLADLGIKVVYTELGIIVALTFIGLPFVIRTVQPVLEDLDKEVEEAAATLSANWFQIFTKIIFPSIRPALITGTTLAFARALGEYGSVVFISGNLPFRTEITAVLIMSKLEQYDYAGATAISVIMLISSFLILLLINLIQWWSTRYK